MATLLGNFRAFFFCTITTWLPALSMAFIWATPDVHAAEALGTRSGAFGWASKRAEVRSQTRWSLDAWLAARERMKWSDLWLSMNSPSPFEFFILGNYNLVPESVGKAHAIRYGAGAYVTNFGLEYEHTQVFETEDHARFHLRLFGNSIQNTHLTFQLGVRRRDLAQALNQWYVGGQTHLYFTKYFGFNLLYRGNLKSIAHAGLGSVSGHRIEVGPFIDYGPIRVQGNYLLERESSSSLPERAARGWSLGLQLFF